MSEAVDELSFLGGSMIHPHDDVPTLFIASIQAMEKRVFDLAFTQVDFTSLSGILTHSG